MHVDGLNELVLYEHYVGENKGHRRVEVGPSDHVPDKTRGVYLSVNHHRDLEVEDSDGAGPAMRAIEQEFDEAITASKKIVSDLKAFAYGLNLV
jgi:hypothetical protein